jgi:hypothetical protein
LVRDFNGDQRADVAIVNIQSSDLSILFGKGDGTFEYPPRNYRTKPGPFAVAQYRVMTKELEEPGLVTVDNGNATISLFLHRGLKHSSSSKQAAASGASAGANGMATTGQPNE